MRSIIPSLALALFLVPVGAGAYPTDEGERTQIRRLGWQQRIDAGTARGRKLAPGAKWPGSSVRLRMREAGKEFDVTPETKKDAKLQAGLEQLLKRESFRDYHVAILDITDPAKPRYAGVAEQVEQTPGSVAKVLVAAGMLRALAQRFPDDIPAREAFLREVEVDADAWLMPNSHEVPVISGEQTSVRAVKLGDRFTLWEWMDHAISPSSNAAGTLVWREATLLSLLGQDYPPKKRDAELFKKWDRSQFTEAVFRTVDLPQSEAGLDPAAFRLRTFFTKGAGKYIKSGGSGTSPLALLRWMLRVEQGRMVDEFSSLELKKLMYLTRRRVRYADTPVLKEAAIYFKSGSFFQCVPEKDYVCIQYRGNKINVLNGLVEVETTGPEPKAYIVAVMSNELRKNAALDHGRLATGIHALIQGD